MSDADDRMIFTVGDDEGLQVVSLGKSLSFHNHDDWCGDTEAGFGAEVTIELDFASVVELHTAIGKWIEKQVATHD
jgi:hypothetical protein